MLGSSEDCRIFRQRWQSRCKRLKIKTILACISKLDKAALNLYTSRHAGPRQRGPKRVCPRKSAMAGRAPANSLRRRRGYEQDYWN